ncbi:MAG: aminotransferase class I/II-fold pyridoxal phosphate-dependent enzyme, partial [Proteobacteria bacterium]|nr:aminotransferase class I/II-fold pyridoxal phosphate-dependent enzyme [Pseudomonadota bacterium]
VWIDDSHAIGVLGEHGRGSRDHFALTADNVVTGGSCAKAIGGFGGVIGGDSRFIEELKRGPTATAASTPSAPDAAATIAGMNLLMAHGSLRKRLRSNTARLKDGLRSIGIPVDSSVVPIVAWQYDDKGAMKSLRDALYEDGIYIQFVQSYGGSDTGGLLRACVFSEHSPGQIDRLVAEIERHVVSVGRPRAKLQAQE